MKNRLKQMTTSLLIVLGVVAVVPSFSASAIDVFSGSCGGSGSGAVSGTGSSPVTTGDGNKGTAPSNNATGNGTTAGTGSSSSLCGAAASDSAPDIVKNIINTMLVVLGMIAVIMIIIGGIRYTTSNGDASQTKAAKDTILYAVVGLIVAIMAFAIVNFVVGRIG